MKVVDVMLDGERYAEVSWDQDARRGEIHYLKGGMAGQRLGIRDERLIEATLQAFVRDRGCTCEVRPEGLQ